jgi:hypothetical protein
MRRHVTLHSWISVILPCAANIIVSLIDSVIYKFLQFWPLMLDLMRENQARKASANCRDFQFPLLVCHLIYHGYAYLGKLRHGRHFEEMPGVLLEAECHEFEKRE